MLITSYCSVTFGSFFCTILTISPNNVFRYSADARLYRIFRPRHSSHFFHQQLSCPAASSASFYQKTLVVSSSVVWEFHLVSSLYKIHRIRKFFILIPTKLIQNPYFLLHSHFQRLSGIYLVFPRAVYRTVPSVTYTPSGSPGPSPGKGSNRLSAVPSQPHVHRSLPVIASFTLHDEVFLVTFQPVIAF